MDLGDIAAQCHAQGFNRALLPNYLKAPVSCWFAREADSGALLPGEGTDAIHQSQSLWQQLGSRGSGLVLGGCG